MSVLRPTINFVLVEVIKDNTEQSGFAIPESVDEKPCKGRVVEGDSFDPGDIIIFRRYKGHELKEDGKDLVFVEHKDIVGYYG